ncbi:MAG TPA: hypothetical protein VIU61_03005 [Kofleriaceae bacterium]
MMSRIAILALVAACSQETAPVAEAPAAKPTGKGGGFSADLAKQIGSNLGGSATAGGATVPAAGSDEPKPEAGSAKPETGSAKPEAVATGSAKPEPGTKPEPAAGSAKPEPKAGSAAKPEPAAGSAKPVPAAGSAKPIPAAGSAKPVPAAGSATTANSNAPLSREQMKPPAELAAIKISLLPNWERDVGEAGTLSFPIKLPSGAVRVFVFRYGIEDAAAPADRDLYKKWLADTKRLSVASDRQRGAAWTLEGNDGSGAGAFRYLINYGGKKLICYGSLYKDAESSKLGDLRDQAILQAKQICETLAL